MNIFILSYQTDWNAHMREQAASHCDKHVIKMITESVQMLSTNLVIDDTLTVLAKGHQPITSAAFGNHPCTKWARDKLINFTYLTELALKLCEEKIHRYPLTAPHQYHGWLKELREKLPTYDSVPAEFPVAIPDCPAATKLTGEYVNLDTAAELYQRYYVTHKASFVSWKNRPVPVWYLIQSDLVNQS